MNTTALENNDSITIAVDVNKKPGSVHTLDDCAFTEQHSMFLQHTRLFTKKRKGWQGKKKPEIKLQGNGTSAGEQRVHNKLMKEFYKGVKVNTDSRDDDDIRSFKSYKKTGAEQWKYSHGCLFTCPYCYQSYNYWKKHEPVCTQEYHSNPFATKTQKTEEDVWREFELELGLY